jgi:hypothetical protein
MNLPTEFGESFGRSKSLKERDSATNSAASGLYCGH